MTSKLNKYHIVGVFFCLAIFMFIFIENEPWKKGDNILKQKEYDNKIEYLRTERIDDFLSDSTIVFCFGDFNENTINKNEFATLIKETQPIYTPVNRSTYFGRISFLGKINDEEFTITLNICNYYKDGFIYVSINKGKGYSGRGKKYSSQELFNWTKESFPEIFDKMRQTIKYNE